MLSISYIREHADRVRAVARDKNVAVDIDALLEVDAERRKLQGRFDALAAERKALAHEQAGKPAARVIARGKEIKEALNVIETKLNEIEQIFIRLLEQVPNIPTDDTPVGQGESDNVVLRQVGKPPVFDFVPREHWELGASLGLIDAETAAAVTGSRFSYLRGELVLLQFALLQYAYMVLTDETLLKEIIVKHSLPVVAKPFVPVLPPAMLRPAVMQKMARLEPREERYHIPSDDLYLVGSAEHTLGPQHMKQTLPETMFPLRYAGYSSSFRREAGSYGKDVRGILRLHQFDKLEIESFTLPEDSLAEQDFIVAIQEYLMQSLKLPYQVILKCTGDMGGPDARAIDIETWLPGQGLYRETHTADLMTDYQARRLETKVKRSNGISEYVHMNDATVFAMGRTLIAIMENYQRHDGSISVPEVLLPYVSFSEIKKAQLDTEPRASSD